MNSKHPLLHSHIIFGTLLVLTFFSFWDGAAQNENDTQKNVQQEQDMGKEPWVLNIEKSTVENSHYRQAKWTGEFMQMVLMSLKSGEIIDLEKHDDVDQFIRVEQGEAQVLMGKHKDSLSYEKNISDDWAVFIPAGYYHKLTNVGDTDLKIYTIYTPAEHPRGIKHETYKEARKYHDKHEAEH